MGVVYAARHDLLGQAFALKFLHPVAAADGLAVARFLNEARAAARIENEHIGRVLDVGTLDSGLPYMLLEYLDGSDLAKVLHDRGPLPVSDLADYLLQAIEAVAHAHVLGIVHRDLKPSNLFLARRPDGTSRVKVLDFGISKVLGAGVSITETRSLVGSPRYMSPEQLLDAKRVDHRCDIWSFGVVAYELLTGVPPFDADNAVALFSAIQSSDAVPVRARRSNIPVDLDAAIQRCLKRFPEDRFGSVTELGAALAPFATAVGAHAFENAKRILPVAEASAREILPPAARGETTSAPHDVVTGNGIAKTMSSGPGPIRDGSDSVSTAAPWSSSRDGAPRASHRRWLGVAAAFVMIAAVVAVTSGRVFRRTSTARGSSPDMTIAPQGPTLPVAASAPVSPSVSPPASRSVSPPASTSVSPPASTSVGAPPLVTPSAATAAPRSSTRRRPIAAPIPTAKPDCNPPFAIDAKGDRRWKVECL